MSPPIALDKPALPTICPKFEVPRLTEKPQNPIMDTIDFIRRHPKSKALPPPGQVVTLAEDVEKTRELRWNYAARQNKSSRNLIMSWDTLITSHPSTPFLSEQPSSVFSAARYHVLPPLQHSTKDVVYVSLHNLLKCLKLTVLGTSSALHYWDPTTERFVQRGLTAGRGSIIIIQGKDEVASASVIQRFVTVGTLLRRLEILFAAFPARKIQEGPTGPTSHAFMHALRSVLAYLRASLTSLPPSESMDDQEVQTLTKLWTHYASSEELLVALSILCHREEQTFPIAYTALPSSPTHLLSYIYSHLATHMDNCSPRHISATFAYILTTSSKDFIQYICHSVGYSHANLFHTIERHQMSPNVSGEDGEVAGGDEFLRNTDELYPTFFPPELSDALPIAKRSLSLLRAAQPDHPLVRGGLSGRAIEWLWTEAGVNAAWGHTAAVHEVMQKDFSPIETAQPIPRRPYKPDIAEFQIFDLEPGIHLTSSTSQTSLLSFLATFPVTLPSLTPTLPLLASLTFSPLIIHTSALSNALLSLFLSASSHLSLHAHLTLLRSYLLLTSHSFKSRLTAALFSNSDGMEPDIQGVRAFMRTPGRLSGEPEIKSWVIGLAPSLAARESWPPGGADLSYHLRTVIVDSLEPREACGMEDDMVRSVVGEAEVRLGFAIRDLPVGSGRDKWLDPLSIEALDFLYMDYKPPHPLEVLITPDILSKYQRMFTFILRVIRVEHVIRALFRMTRDSFSPLFPTLTSSNSLFLHFRFISHSFVGALSEYTFDTAIGGNFDAFLSRLSSHVPDAKAGFSDVFSLANYHSSVMDDILSACLLRSGQRAVGDLLRGALEIVLELGILAGDLKTGRMDEYQAEPQLADLYHKFRGKMKTLTKVLHGLVDKGVASSRSFQHPVLQTNDERVHKPPGGTATLYHLLLRLDVRDWWSG